MAIARFVRAIDEGRPVPVYGDGRARRDFTYVDDIIDGIVRTIERPGGFRVFNLGTERTVTLGDLIEVIERAMGRAATTAPHPAQAGDVPVTHASVERAARELGYAPRTPLEAGIARYVAWYRAQPH
jgi:UDP-glucuronate 4-epimerase